MLFSLNWVYRNNAFDDYMSQAIHPILLYAQFNGNDIMWIRTPSTRYMLHIHTTELSFGYDLFWVFHQFYRELCKQQQTIKLSLNPVLISVKFFRSVWM